MNPFNAEPPARAHLAVPVRVVRVPRQAQWHGTATATRFAKVWTHYIGGCTRPCLSPKFSCLACTNGMHRQWEAYLGWFNDSQQAPQILVVPALCFLDLRELLGGDDEGRMRGYELAFKRIGTRRQDRLIPEVVRRPVEGRKYPAGLDVPLILARMWRLERSVFEALIQSAADDKQSRM